jgi:hypothetical protein
MILHLIFTLPIALLLREGKHRIQFLICSFFHSLKASCQHLCSPYITSTLADLPSLHVILDFRYITSLNLAIVLAERKQPRKRKGVLL